MTAGAERTLTTLKIRIFGRYLALRLCEEELFQREWPHGTPCRCARTMSSIPRRFFRRRRGGVRRAGTSDHRRAMEDKSAADSPRCVSTALRLPILSKL